MTIEEEYRHVWFRVVRLTQIFSGSSRRWWKRRVPEMARDAEVTK